MVGQIDEVACGWEGGDPEEPPWSLELGSDRRLSAEVFLSVPSTNECPKASPCFFVHFPFSVTVGKDLTAPQCRNCFSSPSSSCYIQSPGP